MEVKLLRHIVLVQHRVSMIHVIRGMTTDDESHDDLDNITDDADIKVYHKQAILKLFYFNFLF